MINITAIHMVGGEGHEYIGRLRWINPETDESGESSCQEIVDWLQDDQNQAYVRDARGSVPVGVVKANPPYLRTYADGNWTNNLLSLPRF